MKALTKKNKEKENILTNLELTNLKILEEKQLRQRKRSCWKKRRSIT
jgi:hypothetical protein